VVGESILSYGVRLGIRATDPDIMPALLAELPEGWRRSPVHRVDRLLSFLVGGQERGSRVRRYHLVYDNWLQAARTFDLEHAVVNFGVTARLTIAERSPRRTFVHAGVVGWKGRAIVLPGRTHTGKTTLTAALVRAGAAYLSDEFALIDKHGRIHPFPKPLSIREQPFTPQQNQAVESLGGKQRRRPLPIGLIVISPYESGRRFRPRAVSAGRGVLELLRHTPSARRDPGLAFERLSLIVAEAPVLKGVRGEADEAATAILARLGALPSAA
jgi:hypothetical protein